MKITDSNPEVVSFLRTHFGGNTSAHVMPAQERTKDNKLSYTITPTFTPLLPHERVDFNPDEEEGRTCHYRKPKNVSYMND